MRSQVETDAALAGGIARGEPGALAEAYAAYGALLHGMALRVLADAQLAEECTQDAFVTLWRRAADYDPSRARLGTWLVAIARTRALELARRRARRPVELTGDAGRDGVAGAPDPSDAAARSDDAQRVAGALAELPAEQLAVVRLAYFDGLTHAEIADRLALPLGTVKGRLRLALERLRHLAGRHAVELERAR